MYILFIQLKAKNNYNYINLSKLFILSIRICLIDTIYIYIIFKKGEIPNFIYLIFLLMYNNANIIY